MHRFLLATTLASSLLFAAARARADEPVGLSVSLERAAGFAYASARPTDSSGSLHGTMFSLAGPAVNPLSLPRAAVDVILPMGLTLGGAVGYGNATLTSSSDNTPDSSLGGSAWLVSPRIGYRIRLGSMFDLWPRAGVTFAGATANLPDEITCSSSSFNGVTSSQSCSTRPGDSASFFFAAASLDVAAALRLTSSFNLLGGIAYDHVFAASGSTSPGSGGTSSSAQVEGRYLGAQLWFGLGGYVL